MLPATTGSPPKKDNARVQAGEVGKANYSRPFNHNALPPIAAAACFCRLGRGCLTCRGWDRLLTSREIRLREIGREGV
jgi:hypothetical protein